MPPAIRAASVVRTKEMGATGFDWIAVGLGGVSWLISRPRKKPIKKQLPIGR